MSNTAAHTPGPWYASAGKDYIIIKGVDGDSIASMARNTPDRAAGEQAANAQVMVCAPDMLDVLHDIVALTHHVADRHIVIRVRAEAVIKAATGALNAKVEHPLMPDQDPRETARALVAALRSWLEPYNGWSDTELAKRADRATIDRIHRSRQVVARAEGRPDDE